MAVPEQTPYQEFIANGTTTVFPLNFDAKEQDHLIVLVDDVEPQVGEWSFDFNTDQVTFLKAPKANSVIKIRRDTPFKRDGSYQTYDGSFRPEPVNEDFDNIWRKLQEMGVLNWMVNNNVKDLNEYVDSLNDETKAIFLQMIQEQGTSLAQLDSYVDQLYKNLADVAVDNGWFAEFVATKDGGNQQQVNDNLLGEAGATFINLKFSEISNSIKKSIYDVAYDQLIDVTWFGAKGNWQISNTSGKNNTQAVKNAISFLSTLGTRRQGGRRGLKFPKGSYMLDYMDLPVALGFGIDIIGDGPKTTSLYFNHNSLRPAINCEIEFTQFRNISLIGSLDEKWNTARTVGFFGKLPSKAADIDVTFFNCEITYWNVFTQIHGRGCVFESCMLGAVIAGMEIVVTADQKYGADTDVMQAMWATMRHYVYRNTRFDNTSRAYRVSGEGPMLDHINNLIFVGNDITSMDKLIEAPSATFVNAIIGANTALGSFATNVIEVKAIHMSTISFNNFCKVVDYKKKPTSNLTSTDFFMLASASCTNLTISNNTIKGIRTAFFRNTSIEQSYNISLVNNILPEFGTWKNGNIGIAFYNSDANCKGLIIQGNSFHSSGINGAYYLFNLNNKQYAYDASIQNNYAPWVFIDRKYSYKPTVFVGNSATKGSSSILYCAYVVNGDYIEGDYFLGGAIPEASGNISIDLPLPAIPENYTYSAEYSGSGFVINPAGVSSTGYVFENVFINAATQRLELRKSKDLSSSALTAADFPGYFSMTISFKYRIK